MSIKKEKAWIAMSMRRPIDGNFVEVIFNNKILKAYYSKYNQHTWTILPDQDFDYNYDESWKLDRYITHWRALPTPNIN